jgi:NAD(P)H dehydrogenase (quinone)
MYAILGAAGKAGFSTSSRLRAAGVPVRAILRDESKRNRLEAIGCEVALADLNDASALAQALERCGAARVLAISDYGAHIREWIGMPSAYRLFEERLRLLSMNKVILRSAEHMEGWAAFLPVATASGVLPSLHHPVARMFPTISAPELGRLSAELLLRVEEWTGERILHAEGPRRYSAADVAAALGELLGRPIAAQALPREQWRESLGRVVSPSACQLLIDLYDAQNRGGLVDVEPHGTVIHGTTMVIDALRPLTSAAD